MTRKSARVAVATTLAIALVGCSTNNGADSTLDPADISAAVDLTTTSTTQPLTVRDVEEAAESMARVAQALLFADTDDVSGIITDVATPSGRVDLAAMVNEEIAPVRLALATAPPAVTWWLVIPLSVKTYDVDLPVSASAEVWVLNLFARAGVADPEVTYSLIDMRLVREDDRWLIDAWSDRPGPAARLGSGQVPVTGPELDLQLEGHRLLTFPSRLAAP